jgi:hypothetical protein
MSWPPVRRQAHAPEGRSTSCNYYNYRTTGNVWQLANLRCLCESKVKVHEAFAKLVRVFFAMQHVLAKSVFAFSIALRK